MAYKSVNIRVLHTPNKIVLFLDANCTNHKVDYHYQLIYEKLDFDNLLPSILLEWGYQPKGYFPEVQLYLV